MQAQTLCIRLAQSTCICKPIIAFRNNYLSLTLPLFIYIVTYLYWGLVRPSQSWPQSYPWPEILSCIQVFQGDVVADDDAGLLAWPKSRSVAGADQRASVGSRPLAVLTIGHGQAEAFPSKGLYCLVGIAPKTVEVDPGWRASYWRRKVARWASRTRDPTNCGTDDDGAGHRHSPLLVVVEDARPDGKRLPWTALRVGTGSTLGLELGPRLAMPFWWR